MARDFPFLILLNVIPKLDFVFVNNFVEKSALFFSIILFKEQGVCPSWPAVRETVFLHKEIDG